MAGTLTTHVLDTVLGLGAAAMRVEWRRVSPHPTKPYGAVLVAENQDRKLHGRVEVVRI